MAAHCYFSLPRCRRQLWPSEKAGKWWQEFVSQWLHLCARVHARYEAKEDSIRKSIASGGQEKNPHGTFMLRQKTINTRATRTQELMTEVSLTPSSMETQTEKAANKDVAGVIKREGSELRIGKHLTLPVVSAGRGSNITAQSKTNVIICLNLCGAEEHDFPRSSFQNAGDMKAVARSVW